MIVSELSSSELRARLHGPGLRIRTGPFTSTIQSDVPELVDDIALLYCHHPVSDGEFSDFHVGVERPRGIRRHIRQQISFRFDGNAPFKPLPRPQAMPCLEWGLNWSIANHAHQFLILHAAALAKDGAALILPGPPGAGKSTLCAALANRGWQLLSDELTLIEPSTGLAYPLARPINLKNQSIELLRAFATEAAFSRIASDTAKGTVALLRPPRDSVAAMDSPARPTWIILPQFVSGAQPAISNQSRARMVIELGRNAFNYSILGKTGFDALADLVDGCACLSFRYGGLDEAVSAINDVVLHEKCAGHARANVA